MIVVRIGRWEGRLSVFSVPAGLAFVRLPATSQGDVTHESVAQEWAKYKVRLPCFALSGLIFFGIGYPGRRYTASPLRFALG